MTKTIPVKCAIFDTHYTITRHRDGTGTVRAPYIKWRNNTGYLDFYIYHIPAARMPQVSQFFDDGELCNQDCIALEDYLR